MLNDSPDEQKSLTAEIYLIDGDVKTKLSTISIPACAPRSNAKGGSFEFTVPGDLSEKFAISVECVEEPAFSSVYDLVHNLKETAKTALSGGDVANEFADFLK